jgi:hypothetical protein
MSTKYQLLRMAIARDGTGIEPCRKINGELLPWDKCIQSIDNREYLYYNVKDTKTTHCVHKSI